MPNILLYRFQHIYSNYFDNVVFFLCDYASITSDLTISCWFDMPLYVRHVIRFLSALSHGLRHIDEQCLVGSSQEVDEGRDAARLADRLTIGRVLCQLSQGSDYVH